LDQVELEVVLVVVVAADHTQSLEQMEQMVGLVVMAERMVPEGSEGHLESRVLVEQPMEMVISLSQMQICT
jgi:CMP-2-keto-3-deoxyoctulosonic acid synthetase